MNGTANVRFAEHLATRLGAAARVPADVAQRADRLLGPGAFSAVIAPPDAGAVAEALAECTAEGWPVIAAGACTWLRTSAHVATDRAPVVISTARLDRVTEHEPADLVVGVQAGMPIVRLREILAEKRQWLPLDPAADDAATAGAVAALAAAGPLRAGHGTPRDMVLGVEVAAPDGRLLRFGGRVVKNVAGYDGVRLTIGSRGALGIITGLYVRVRGAPRADRTVAIACGPGPDGAAYGAAAALAVRDAATCDALELIAPATSAQLSRGSADDGWTLLVRVTGSEPAVRDALDRVRNLAARRAGSGTGPGAPVADVPPDVWADLTRLEARATVALRLTGPPAQLPAGLSLIHDIFASGNGMDAWQGAAHAADGVIRLWHDGADPAIVSRMDALSSRLRGTGDHAPGSIWTMRYDMPPRGTATVSRDTPAAVRELTRRVRSVFDRAGIMQVEGLE